MKDIPVRILTQQTRIEGAGSDRIHLLFQKEQLLDLINRAATNPTILKIGLPKMNIDLRLEFFDPKLNQVETEYSKAAQDEHMEILQISVL